MLSIMGVFGNTMVNQVGGTNEAEKNFNHRRQSCFSRFIGYYYRQDTWL